MINSLHTLRPGMVIGGVNSLPSLFETRYGVVLGFGFNTGFDLFRQIES